MEDLEKFFEQANEDVFFAMRSTNDEENEQNIEQLHEHLKDTLPSEGGADALTIALKDCSRTLKELMGKHEVLAHLVLIVDSDFGVATAMRTTPGRHKPKTLEYKAVIDRLCSDVERDFSKKVNIVDQVATAKEFDKLVESLPKPSKQLAKQIEKVTEDIPQLIDDIMSACELEDDEEFSRALYKQVNKFGKFIEVDTPHNDKLILTTIVCALTKLALIAREDVDEEDDDERSIKAVNKMLEKFAKYDQE